MHFLEPEQRIKERLTQHLAGRVRAVLSAADLAGVTEARQATPAVHVIYGGCRPAEVQANGSIARITQTWYVVVAVRNLRSPKTGEDARQDAGPLVSAVFEALQGWRPADGWRPLAPAASPAPRYSAGFAYVPTAWTTEVRTRGAP